MWPALQNAPVAQPAKAHPARDDVVELFIRRRDGVEPTDAALRLLTRIRAALADIEAALDDVMRGQAVDFVRSHRGPPLYSPPLPIALNAWGSSRTLTSLQNRFDRTTSRAGLI